MGRISFTDKFWAGKLASEMSARDFSSLEPEVRWAASFVANLWRTTSSLPEAIRKWAADNPATLSTTERDALLREMEIERQEAEILLEELRVNGIDKRAPLTLPEFLSNIKGRHKLSPGEIEELRQLRLQAETVQRAMSEVLRRATELRAKHPGRRISGDVHLDVLRTNFSCSLQANQHRRRRVSAAIEAALSSREGTRAIDYEAALEVIDAAVNDLEREASVEEPGRVLSVIELQLNGRLMPPEIHARSLRHTIWLTELRLVLKPLVLLFRSPLEFFFAEIDNFFPRELDAAFASYAEIRDGAHTRDCLDIFDHRPHARVLSVVRKWGVAALVHPVLQREFADAAGDPESGFLKLIVDLEKRVGFRSSGGSRQKAPEVDYLAIGQKYEKAPRGKATQVLIDATVEIFERHGIEMSPETLRKKVNKALKAARTSK